MNEEEYITDYITTLATADIELSGNTPAELRFNGTGRTLQAIAEERSHRNPRHLPNRARRRQQQDDTLHGTATPARHERHHHLPRRALHPPFPARDEKRCSPAPGTTGHSHPLPRGRLPAGGTGCLPPFTRVDERAASRPSLAAMPKRHRIGSCRDAIIPLRHGHRRMHA